MKRFSFAPGRARLSSAPCGALLPLRSPAPARAPWILNRALRLAAFLAVFAVLPLWCGGQTTPPPPAQPEAPAEIQTRGTVTFCSYNLKNYLKMPRMVDGVRVEDAPKPAEEIAAVVRFLVGIQPDILGVCEIGDENDVRDLQTRLRAAGIHLPHVELAHGGDPVRRLALLSRFPIVQRASQKDLQYRIGDVVLPMQRGILDATVAIHPGHQVRFLGVHFKSQREVPGADQRLMRRNEAHLLRRHIDSILRTAPETRLLAYGDFNTTKNEAAIVEIEGVPGIDLSMMDVRLRDSRGETWTHYWETADLYSRLDYLFVNRALQSEVVRDQEVSYVHDDPAWAEGSDHRAIVTSLRVKQPR